MEGRLDGGFTRLAWIKVRPNLSIRLSRIALAHVAKRRQSFDTLRFRLSLHKVILPAPRVLIEACERQDAERQCADVFAPRPVQLLYEFIPGGNVKKAP